MYKPLLVYFQYLSETCLSKKLVHYLKPELPFCSNTDKKLLKSKIWSRQWQVL